MSEYLPVICVLIGLLIGGLVIWLASSSRNKETQKTITDLKNKILEEAGKNETLRASESSLRENLVGMEVRLEEEKKAAKERQELLEKAEKRLSNTFKALSAETLKASQDQFLTLAKSSLKNQQQEATHELEKRKQAVEQLVKPINQTLEKVQTQITETEKLRVGDKEALKQQMVQISEVNMNLQRETSKLVKALRQPTGRGQWGEVQLKRVVEMAGMQQHCDFVTQTTTTNDEGKRLRPDLIVKLPGGQSVVVDSKAPMDAYLDAVEAESDTARDSAMARHAAQVRTHIQQLGSKKYQDQFEQTPEFVVLFLPSESFFSAALGEDAGLIEKGVDQNVILATPTTLIALLRAVAFGWRQEALAENAREISAVGKTLYERLGVFAGHLTTVGKNLETSVKNYNKAVGSFERSVVPGARKFTELKVASENEKLENVTPAEAVPRALSVDLPEPKEAEAQIDQKNDKGDDEGFVGFV